MHISGLFFSRFRGCRAGSEHLPTEFRYVLSRIWAPRGYLQNCQTDFWFSTPSPGGALVNKKVIFPNISRTWSERKPKFSGSIGNLSGYQPVEGRWSPISTSGLTDVRSFRWDQNGGICCWSSIRNLGTRPTPLYEGRKKLLRML